MKRILTVLLLVAISWSVTAVAKAQDEGQASKTKKVTETVRTTAADEKMMPEPQAQLMRLTKGLQLTEEQQKRIKPLLEDEYAKLKEIRENEDISPKQISKKVEELRGDTIAKILTCLTPEQKEKYALVSNEIKANKQQRMKENRKSRIGTKADPPQQP